MEIRAVKKEDTYSLRHRILRPTELLSHCFYELDDKSMHFGAFIEGVVVGVVTAHPEQKRDFDYLNQYRIRGMAVDHSVQGRGVGRALLDALLAEFVRVGVPFTWCNAREVAFPFYEAMGFQYLGDYFELPNIGRHKVMYRETSL